MSSTGSVPNRPSDEQRSELMALWGRVLSSGPDIDPEESVIAELSEFFGLSEAEVRHRCDHSKELSRDEWLEGDRETSEDLIDFWNQSASVFGILRSHAKQFHEIHPPSSVEIARGLHDLPRGHMLDFGVGPGSNAMFFHALGWRVTVSDISTVMLEFARWRAGTRGIEMAYLDTRHTRLPSDTFDLVIALEVMHVLPDTAATLKEIHDSMHLGGSFVFNVYAPPRGPDTFSYLYDAAWPIMRKVRRTGFKKHRRIDRFYHYEKVSRGRASTMAVTLVDILRFNRYVTMVGNRVRARRARLARPTPKRVPSLAPARNT